MGIVAAKELAIKSEEMNCYSIVWLSCCVSYISCSGRGC